MTPGEQLANWMELHEGLSELTGANDVPLIERHYGDARGKAWCAAIVLIGIRELGLPRPPGNISRRGWRWHNRSVFAWWGNASRAGTTMGPACIPQRGDLLFHGNRRGSDAGSGSGLGHIDVVLGYSERVMDVIGGNVSNAMRRRPLAHPYPGALGFGQIVPPLKG